MIFLFCFFIVGCAKGRNIETSIEDEKISIEKKFCKDSFVVANIFNKLENGGLTYDDIFSVDYGKYSEKNSKTMVVLDELVEKISLHSINNKNSTTAYKIDFDKMLNDNLDKIVFSLLNKENLKYNIYGSNRERWFSEDKNLKAPLNYLQQQVVLNASGKVLEKISCEVVKAVLKSDKDYVINFGILWSVYGNGNKLKKCFDMIHEYISARYKKVVVEKRKLSEKEINILNKIVAMKSFEKIKTTDFIEVAAKAKVVSICKSEIKLADKVLKANNMLV